MEGFKAKFRLVTIVILSIGIVLVAIYDLLKPISNGCAMTYMYPTYIPISATKSSSSLKYGLYLYYEGWKQIDYNEHLKQLSGVPVLFIPGNGGSYKQVRSLAAESDRAYQSGPPQPMLYQEASLEGVEMDETYAPRSSQYKRRLDWFAVDLEGEHSAMDAQILQDHTEYIVYAIHRILDLYKESRVKEGAVESGSLPNNVILVGHSMGGFVARAAVVHPNLRNYSYTISSTSVTIMNTLIRNGERVTMSKRQLSRVIVISISGGGNDYQTEPGSQTEQPPPSAVFWLDPKDMHGFRFLTISVAPSLTVSGRPPPAASMAVGQFFNPEEGHKEFVPKSLLLSMYSQKDIFIKEDHPVVMNLTFSISLGLLPATVSLVTTGCGIKKSGLSVEEAGDMDNGRLCKLRCFPPVALAQDHTSGLHIFPNLHSRKIEVDSSPALWTSSEQTNVLLLVDPHCSYKISSAVSLTSAGRRFMLLYNSQIIGFSFAIVYFALMRQANAWEVDLPVPSLLSAVESNLRLPLPFLLLTISPILIALFYSWLNPKPFPSVGSFFVVSMICYLIANGTVIILILITLILSHLFARIHVYFKTRWLLDLSASFFSFKVMRVINANPSLATPLLAIALVCFVHPALGLLTVVFSHMLCCHHALCSYLTASSKVRTRDIFRFGKGGKSSNVRHDESKEGLPVDENSSTTPDSARSYGDTQLEIFHHRHGLLILHLLSLLMFLPSLVAWLERLSMGHKFPWLLDSMVCMGIVLHAICDSKPEFNVFFQIPGMRGYEIRQGFVYLVAGYFCYLSGLDLVPYKAFYAMAAIGALSFFFRIIERRNRSSGEVYHSSRKHSHRH